MEKIVSAKTVAEFLGITEGTVYKLAKSGQIPGVRIGNQWRFDMETLKKMFQKGEKGDPGRPEGLKG